MDRLINFIKRLPFVNRRQGKMPQDDVDEKPKVMSNLTKDHFKNRPYLIGDYTYGTPEIIDFSQNTKLEIGKFCSIGDNVKILLGGNHRTDWISTYPFNVFNFVFTEGVNITGHPSTKGDIKIGNDVWIGFSSIILSGVTIGDGAVIGAGSVITKNIGPYEIWAGNPAKFIRTRFDNDVIKKLLKIEWWNFDFEKINKIVPYLCSGNINEFINICKQPDCIQSYSIEDSLTNKPI